MNKNTSVFFCVTRFTLSQENNNLIKRLRIFKRKAFQLGRGIENKFWDTQKTAKERETHTTNGSKVNHAFNISSLVQAILQFYPATTSTKNVKTIYGFDLQNPF